MTHTSPQKGPTILLVAGETSGDIHGAELVRRLKVHRPGAHFIGTGGSRMAAAGQNQLFDMTQHAVVGLVEVARHYAKFKRLFDQLLNLAKKEEPEAVVLIDFPGFNLRLAAELRRILPKTRIIYYISPQVWAWKGGRAKTMAKYLDLVIVIFEFEKEWFTQKAPHLRVEWVGHPLLDRMFVQEKPKHFFHKTRDHQTVCLLPGSRQGEIQKHFSILLETAKILYHDNPKLRFLWVCPDENIHKKGQQIIKKHKAGNLPLDIYVGYQLSHLARCDLALLASGSVSLECAALGVPQILFYLVNPITYFVGKKIVKVKFLSIVNILANKPIVLELVQDRLRPEDLAQEASTLLNNPKARSQMRDNYKIALDQLGQPGASDRAARLILKEINPVPVTPTKPNGPALTPVI